MILRDKMPRCKICGAKKIIFIDGSWVCDACEVGGINNEGSAEGLVHRWHW